MVNTALGRQAIPWGLTGDRAEIRAPDLNCQRRSAHSWSSWADHRRSRSAPINRPTKAPRASAAAISPKVQPAARRPATQAA